MSHVELVSRGNKLILLYADAHCVIYQGSICVANQLPSKELNDSAAIKAVHAMYRKTVVNRHTDDKLVARIPLVDFTTCYLDVPLVRTPIDKKDDPQNATAENTCDAQHLLQSWTYDTWNTVSELHSLKNYQFFDTVSRWPNLVKFNTTYGFATTTSSGINVLFAGCPANQVRWISEIPRTDHYDPPHYGQKWGAVVESLGMMNSGVLQAIRFTDEYFHKEYRVCRMVDKYYNSSASSAARVVPSECYATISKKKFIYLHTVMLGWMLQNADELVGYDLDVKFVFDEDHAEVMLYRSNVQRLQLSRMTEMPGYYNIDVVPTQIIINGWHCG